MPPATEEDKARETIDNLLTAAAWHETTRHLLFPSGLRKKHIGEFEARGFRPLYLVTLAALGCSTVQIKKAELALRPTRFDTATDRSEPGSLTIAVQDAAARVHDDVNVMDIDSAAFACKPCAVRIIQAPASRNFPCRRGSIEDRRKPGTR